MADLRRDDDAEYRAWWHSWLDYCRHQLADIDQRITAKPFVSLPRADQSFFEPQSAPGVDEDPAF